MSLAISLAERHLIPDSLTRIGIRRLLQDRLDEQASVDGAIARQGYIESLDSQPLAIATDAANTQHYEVPAAFFRCVMGHRLKYSSGWWGEGVTTLDQAEDAMLALSCARAQLEDGMDVLELGCGWGSLTLFMAERFPRSRITAVSNSNSQREYITTQARERGLGNVTVVTRNLIDFEASGFYDRVVSVECFEHLRNYGELFRRIRRWLKPDGKLWTHIFVHQTWTYPFADSGRDDDWMSRHFFTGGQMPSFDLFRRFDRDLVVEEAIPVNGRHYGRTARAWLDNVDRQRNDAIRALATTCDDPVRQVNRWRMFFMACEELWNWGTGEEWLVGHYRLRQR